MEKDAALLMEMARWERPATSAQADPIDTATGETDETRQGETRRDEKQHTTFD
jgi:hypothetical protein